MGKRGPRPKPTALKVLEGRGSRRELDREPRPTPLAPDPPAFLEGRALEVWHELAPELERMGLLTAVDAAPLAAYSVAVAMHEAASAELLRDGPTVAGARGRERVKHPAAQVARDSAGMIARFGAALGLDPASRASIRLPERPRITLEEILDG
jgi:P27 family predicted phage terminase small subunit